MAENEHADARQDDRLKVASGAQPPLPPPPPPVQPSVSALIIGQATAVIAAAAAVIYAAGGLALGLRLWYAQYSWEPVLGELPKNFLLVDALIVLAFATIIAIATYPLHEKTKRFRKSQNP
jgi:hypothetical protein